MNVAFIEAEEIARNRDNYFVDDDDFRRFQDHLVMNPRSGDVEPGLGNVRKVRWKDERHGKGKSGGMRVYYVYVEAAAIILLLSVYGKGRTDVLTYEERKDIAMKARQFKEEVIALRGYKT
jgi:mRNA-degrading endonuclease RelE of RelBE toxin-antitoxin system